MMKKVPILKQYKGGDGRYRPGIGYGAIKLDRIVYLESTGTWQDKSITCVHFDDGSMVDVLLSIDEIAELQNDESD